MNKKFYITSAIPYVNSSPHVGHALEFVQTDVIARHHKLLGEKVILLCGADENALKNVQAAEKAGIPIQRFVDKNSEIFYQLTKKLNCRYDLWQKGSDQIHHFPSSQKLWQLCFKNNDIYQKKYRGLYCVGCEIFYDKEELNENGECPEHPGKKLETVSEENYFFKLSKYQNQLKELIESDELAIIPQTRKNEVLSFLKQPLKDISISRTNERAKNWGVPVPGDVNQRIYVWFDALNIYQSGIGFGWDEKNYQKWWPADVQVIGKGIIRFHAVYWPAFLLSAGLKLPKSLFVHGYFTVNGQKMSKTLGNIIDPFKIIDRYGTDAFRYYLLREIPAYGDGDFSESRFKELYNADLANGLGNLVSRIAKLAEKISAQNLASQGDTLRSYNFPDNYRLPLREFRFNDALAFVWEKVTTANKTVDETKPWELKGETLNKVLLDLINKILEIAFLLEPFLPETAEKIKQQFLSPKIKSAKPLFPRIA